MRYFTVLAEDASQKVQLEADVPASELLPLFSGIETELKRQRWFDKNEELLKRLVPGYSAQPQALNTRFYPDTPPDIGKLSYDVYLAGQPTGEPSQPLRSISLWFCSAESGRRCTVEFPLPALFASAQAYLAAEFERNSFQKGQAPLAYKVFLNGEGSFDVPRRHTSTTLLVITPGELKVKDLVGLDQVEGGRQPVEVVVTERQSLVMPKKRAWAEIQAKVEGVRQRGDLRVLVRRSALEQVWRQVREAAETRLMRAAKDELYEVGGLFLGTVYEDEEGKRFIDIEEAWSKDTNSKFTFTTTLKNPKLRQEIFDESEKSFPDKQCLGWYRISMTGGDLPELVTRTSRPWSYDNEGKLYSYYSQIHQSLFSVDWQVMLDAHELTRRYTFYQWKKGAIEPCQGYYVYE